jgi:hypothetical protein
MSGGGIEGMSGGGIEGMSSGGIEGMSSGGIEGMSSGGTGNAFSFNFCPRRKKVGQLHTPAFSPSGKRLGPSASLEALESRKPFLPSHHLNYLCSATIPTELSLLE